jgi:fibronectin type 3 domain-containing protein
VYRAASGSSSYAMLNSTVETATVFVDSTVVAGSAYNYIVESVDAAGTSSTPSNMFAVTIP